jgi:hypothetical protein
MSMNYIQTLNKVSFVRIRYCPIVCVITLCTEVEMQNIALGQI